MHHNVVRQKNEKEYEAALFKSIEQADPPPAKKEGSNATIDTFFQRVFSRPETEKDKSVDVPHSTNTATERASASTASFCPLSSDSDMQVSSSSTDPKEPVFLSYQSADKVPNDIGNFINEKLDDFQKHLLVINHWQPPQNYEFPHSVHNKKGKDEKRYLGHQHLQKYSSWLVYSHSKKGLFCKYCPLFNKGMVSGGQKTVPLRKLVTQPLTSFSKLLGEKGDLDHHAMNHYHKAAMEAGKLFVQTYVNPDLDVRNQVNQQRLDQVEENRSRLKPTIETVILSGRQNIPLRGHRDDGSLYGQNEVKAKNEGNFRELLRFRVSAGDSKLAEHLNTASSRATYISKTTQNELIDCCGAEILSKILNMVYKAEFYSIVFDETTDLAHRSQISLLLRYEFEGEIREDFVCFTDAFKELKVKETEGADADNDFVTETETEEEKDDEQELELSLIGKALGGLVVGQMKKIGLQTDYCVGIGTDDCSVMSSEAKGAVAEIKKEAKNAKRSPCYNHSLNLSVSKSNKVVYVRNSVGTMKEVIVFFTSSAKRNSVLLKNLESQLSGLCETRRVERHDGVIQFSADMSKIISALDEISLWKDNSAASKAASLSASLCSSQFLVSMICLKDLLALTLPLSRGLQKVSLDVSTASDNVSNVLTVLEKRRANSDEFFSSLWAEIKELAQSVGVEELLVPRTCGKQLFRDNYEGSVEVYYRRSVYVPLLDFMINDLKDRFSDENFQIFHLSFLMPSVMNSFSIKFEDQKAEDEHINNCINEVITSYSSFFRATKACTIACLKGEYAVWREKWKKIPETNSTAKYVLKNCDKDTFPVIHRLLRILVTLPVSTAGSERNFSTLRRLETWTRTRMTQERLVGLALLIVHRDVDVHVDSVIDRFAKSARRLPFVV